MTAEDVILAGVGVGALALICVAVIVFAVLEHGWADVARWFAVVGTILAFPVVGALISYTIVIGW